MSEKRIVWWYFCRAMSNIILIFASLQVETHWPGSGYSTRGTCPNKFGSIMVCLGHGFIDIEVWWGIPKYCARNFNIHGLISKGDRIGSDELIFDWHVYYTIYIYSFKEIAQYNRSNRLAHFWYHFSSQKRYLFMIFTPSSVSMHTEAIFERKWVSRWSVRSISSLTNCKRSFWLVFRWKFHHGVDRINLVSDCALVCFSFQNSSWVFLFLLESSILGLW